MSEDLRKATPGSVYETRGGTREEFASLDRTGKIADFKSGLSVWAETGKFFLDDRESIDDIVRRGEAGRAKPEFYESGKIFPAGD